MKFFVIYDFDLPRDVSVRGYRPPKYRRLWQLTEGDESYDFDDEQWCHGGHRKYVTYAPISRKEFNRFLDVVGLYAEDVETMGSLTLWGWFPAVAFNGDDQEALQQCAYVTPIPQRPDGTERTGMNDRDWSRVRRAMIAIYG